MLSPETLESYRRMTPGQRLRLTFDLTDDATKALLAGSPETIDRRLMLLSIVRQISIRSFVSRDSDAST